MVAMRIHSFNIIQQIGWSLLIVSTCSIAQNMRTLRLSQINDMDYQCNNPGCSPSTQITALTLRRCQLFCISDNNCRTATYQRLNQTCRLYPDIPSQYGIIVPAIDVITLLAIDERQLTARM